MSEQEKEILGKLLKEFPGGSVAVQDVSGGSSTDTQTLVDVPTDIHLFLKAAVVPSSQSR